MAALYSLIRFLPRTAFVLTVQDGAVKAHAPHRLPAGFVSAVQDKADRGELRSCVVYGKRQRGGLTLGFLGVPERVQQPLLNSWHAHKQQYVG